MLGPFIIAFWGAVRILENEYKIRIIGDYIREIENRFEVNGWEHRMVVGKPRDRKLWQGFVLVVGLPVITAAVEVGAIFYRLVYQPALSP